MFTITIPFKDIKSASIKLDGVEKLWPVNGLRNFLEKDGAELVIEKRQEGDKE